MRKTWIAIAATLLLVLVAWRVAETPARAPRASTASGASAEPDAPARTADEEPSARRPAFREIETPAPPAVPHVVRVLDSRSEPACGVAVRFHLARGGESWPGPPLANGITDAQGQARFEAMPRDSYEIQAQSEREAGRGQMGAGTMETTIRMEPTLRVFGTILDRDGAAVGGAMVMLSLSGPVRGAQTPVFWALSDSDGHVPIADREVGGRPYYQIEARGYRTAFGELERHSLLAAGFTIRLDPLTSVSGRIVHEAGQGVEARVTVLETMKSTLSGADGRFEVPGLPETGGTLVIAPPKLAGRTLRNVRPGPLGDIVLGPGLSISGVARLDGVPVRGAAVATRSDETGFLASDARTDAGGRFVVPRLAEGTYNLTIVDPEGGAAPRIVANARVRGVAAGTKDLVLTLRRHPTLVIELVSAETGEEAWVLRLEARATLRGTAETVSQVIESRRHRRVKDTVLEVETAGEYDVAVLVPGCPEQVVPVALTPDEWKIVKVRVPRVQ